MSRVARVGGVALSVVAHVGVGALLLSLSVMDWSPPLFVDLTEVGDRADGRAGAAGGGGPQPSERPAKATPPAPRVVPARPRATSPLEPPHQATMSPPPAPPALMVEPGPVTEPMPSRDVSPPPSSASSPTLPDLSGQQALLGTSSSSGPAASSGAGASENGIGQASRGATDGAGLTSGGRGSDSTGIPPEYGPYLRRFRERVQESLVFPLAARRQGLHGTVELDIWLDPAGRVREVRMARSSSHALLDEAAVTTVRQLAPLPFPESLPRRILAIRLPLVFDLR